MRRPWARRRTRSLDAGVFAAGAVDAAQHDGRARAVCQPVAGHVQPGRRADRSGSPEREPHHGGNDEHHRADDRTGDGRVSERHGRTPSAGIDDLAPRPRNGGAVAHPALKTIMAQRNDLCATATGPTRWQAGRVTVDSLDRTRGGRPAVAAVPAGRSRRAPRPVRRDGRLAKAVEKYRVPCLDKCLITWRTTAGRDRSARPAAPGMRCTRSISCRPVLTVSGTGRRRARNRR